jgi:hypothetical protein
MLPQAPKFDRFCDRAPSDSSAPAALWVPACPTDLGPWAEGPRDGAIWSEGAMKANWITPSESRGPPSQRSAGGSVGPGFPHGSSPWAEGPRESALVAVSSRRHEPIAAFPAKAGIHPPAGTAHQAIAMTCEPMRRSCSRPMGPGFRRGSGKLSGKGILSQALSRGRRQVVGGPWRSLCVLAVSSFVL